MSHPSGQVGFSGHTRQTPSRRPKGLRPLLGRFAPEPRVTPISVVLLRTPPARRLRRAPAANTWPSEGRQGQRWLQATTVSDHRASSDGTCDLIWLHRSGPHELRNNSASTFGYRFFSNRDKLDLIARYWTFGRRRSAWDSYKPSTISILCRIAFEQAINKA